MPNPSQFILLSLGTMGNRQLRRGVYNLLGIIEIYKKWLGAMGEKHFEGVERSTPIFFP